MKRSLAALLGLGVFFFSVALPRLDAQTITIQELKRSLVKKGNLKFLTDISIKYMEKDRMTRYLSRVAEKEYASDMAAKDAAFLYLMGFSDKPLELKQARSKIIVNNAGVYYNEKTGELVALPKFRKPNMMNAVTLVHEMRLALVDQHFDISGILGAHSLFDDRGLARLAAIKGDSTFVMVVFNGFSPEVMASTFSSESLLSMSPLGTTAQLHKAPDVVQQQFVMPHVHGLRFMAGVFKKKKWKGILRVLNEPPNSSEQILHPEKYLKLEEPEEIEITFKPEGYNLYHSGVIGEFYLGVMLGKHKSYQSPPLGWGGDAFQIYRKDKNYFMIWKSSWDDDRFSGNFYYEYKRFLEKKYEVHFKEGNVNGAIFIAGHTGEHYYFLRRVSDRMIYIRTNDREQMNKFIYGGNYD